MINYNLKIDCQSEKTLSSNMTFVSGDVGAYRLIFDFYDNGEKIDIKDYILVVRAKRADGKVISGSGEIIDGKGVFVPKNSIYAIPGEVLMEIALCDSAKNYITTKIILAEVIEGLGEGTEVQADEISVFVSMMGQIKEKIDSAQRLMDESVAVIKQDINDALVNKLTYKGKVTELPTEDLSVGDVYEITPAVKKLYTGKFSDYFTYFWNASEALGVTCYTDKGATVFDYSANMEYFEQSKTNPYLYRTYIYDMDGNLVLSKAERDAFIELGYDVEACNFGGGIDVVLFESELKNLTGWDDELGTESVVSFYICKTRYDEGLPNSSLYLWNGDEWVDLLNTKQIGDIETALDSIITIQNELIGGGAQ